MDLGQAYAWRLEYKGMAEIPASLIKDILPPPLPQPPPPPQRQQGSEGFYSGISLIA